MSGVGRSGEEGAQLAKDVLTMAADGGMPDSFWVTDARILRACEVLGWDAVEAQAFAEGK